MKIEKVKKKIRERRTYRTREEKATTKLKKKNHNLGGISVP